MDEPTITIHPMVWLGWAVILVFGWFFIRMFFEWLPTFLVKWYRKAAESGYVSAQLNLGTRYDEGRGVAEDAVEAMKWYRRAAEQNDAQAQHNLGYCYDNGRGVARDKVEAAKWYRKAAEQNFGPAQDNLGFCYVDGIGVTRDYVEAYKWFLVAAGQGYNPAKENMAVSEKLLTPEQIAEGQKLAREFKPHKATDSGNSI